MDTPKNKSKLVQKQKAFAWICYDFNHKKLPVRPVSPPNHSLCSHQMLARSDIAIIGASLNNAESYLPYGQPMRSTVLFRVLASSFCLAMLSAGCMKSPTKPDSVAKTTDAPNLIKALEASGAKLKLDGDGHVIEADFRGSQVADDGLSPLTKLAKIRSVKLNETSITDAGLSTIGSIGTLTNLDLRGCSVTDQGVAKLAGLQKLKAIRFSGKSGLTDVTDQSMDVLAGLPNLQVLAIDFLKFAGGKEGLTKLAGLPLQELYASNTLINDESLELLANTFPDLKKLRASGCQVSSEGLKAIGKMTNLQELDLSENTSIFDDGLAHLQPMHQLQKLNLWRVPITDEGVASLAGLTEMQWLNLDNVAYLSDEGLPHLKGMTKLKFLHLGSTSVTDEGMVHLVPLTDLADLKVTRTGVTQDGVDQLKKTLTNTAIQLKYEGT